MIQRKYENLNTVKSTVLEEWIEAALPPVKELIVATGEEAGWAPEPVWILWREKSLVCARN
jgi:hypothetical protein